MSGVLKILSRSSPLARVQVHEALFALEEYWAQRSPQLPSFETQFLTSWGDRHKEVSLLDGQAPADLFTRELDTALFQGQADFAIHSAKDLPVPLPEGLVVAALLTPKTGTDALVCSQELGKLTFPNGLPPRARVGTSSPLRQAEVLAARKDLTIVPIRGTIEERLALVDRGELDALIVATCALERLGLTARISAILPFDTHPLQGYLAVTCRADRGDVRALWGGLDVRSPEKHNDEEVLWPENQVQAGPPHTWYAGTDPSRFWRPRGIWHHALISLDPLSPEELDQALAQTPQYTWVALTSRTAVRIVTGAWRRLGWQSPQPWKIAAVGRATAQALKDEGWIADLIAEREDAQGLVSALANRSAEGKKLLFPASEIASEVLSGLSHQGWTVQRVTVYRNRPLACPDPDWSQIEEVVVTSPSCARVLYSCFPQLPPNLLLTPMGEPTAVALQELYPTFRLGPSVLGIRRTSHHG